MLPTDATSAIPATANPTTTPSGRRWTALVAVNAVSAVIGAAYGLVGLIAPASRPGIAGAATDDLVTYAALYGIRAVLLAGAVLAVLLLARWAGIWVLTSVLWLAGAVQVGDTLLFVALGDPVGAAGPAVGAATHLASAVLVSRWVAASGPITGPVTEPRRP